MKKLIAGIVTALAALLVLAGCGSADNSHKIVIGASPTPHAEILEKVKPILKKEGYDLEIKVFDDYVLPNKALNAGDLDANYFQHIPYLDLEVKKKGYKIVNAGAVHLEVMGVYSKTVKNIKDLKDGATVITSNSPSDWGRIITIFQDAGLVTLKDGVKKTEATFEDIATNPKHLVFKHDINPELLTQAYNNEEADLVAINANFAFGAKLNPQKDALLVEKDNSPYVNIIATQTSHKDDAKIKALVKALHDKTIVDYVNEKWGGSVKIVPASSK
ncbi:MAG: methionine ABC transporter substrate-binding protein [Lactobacillales bacterium]|jgi:D-methionine transport system substrate-binding protein|nr:methionine ABC transporter substrate-binding protein [Lactobacillales bacterium]